MLIKAEISAEARQKAYASSIAAFDDYDFEGWNCNEYEDVCSGWDGVSTRCNCGNRRVEWIAEETEEPGVYEVYAAAY